MQVSVGLSIKLVRWLFMFPYSDGVGRSGAFLCIHSQLERLKTEGEIDVFKYLKSARTKRIGLVSEIVSCSIDAI